MKRIPCLLLVLGLCLAPALVSAGEKEPELIDKVFTVPPTFPGDVAAMEPQAPAPNRALQENLMRIGVEFPEGSHVIYNPAASQIIVRNTAAQLERVEAAVEASVTNIVVLALLSVREAVVDRSAFEALEFRRPDGLQSDGREQSENLPSIETVEDLLARLGRPPEKAEPQEPAPGPDYGFCGLFTEEEFQEAWNQIKEIGGARLASPPSVVMQSDNPALIEAEGSRWGFVPVIGSDRFTMEIAAYIPPPGGILERDPGGKIEPSVQVTIWDGQTFAYAEKLDGDRVRLSFVTGQLLDPAGMPLHADAEAPIPSDRPPVLPSGED